MADNRELEQFLPDLSDPNQRHESRDINVWAIGKIGIGLVLTTIASIFIVFGVFRFLQVQYQKHPPRAFEIQDARQLPPEPRLVPNEPESLEEMRTAEDAILNGYSWANQDHTEVKIPIDKAIDKLLAKGLPARAQAPAEAPDGVSVPTDSGLGEKIQQVGGPLAGELK
ncbi:MAG TPA: hypothetical protein VKV17_13900 [Bryobacteraceae bacterium]|nr:hypothetical protein [Bryobacteraceae bacterium]